MTSTSREAMPSIGFMCLAVCEKFFESIAFDFLCLITVFAQLRLYRSKIVRLSNKNFQVSVFIRFCFLLLSNTSLNLSTNDTCISLKMNFSALQENYSKFPKITILRLIKYV